MLRIISLLSPVYVCLFWAIVLAGNKRKYSTPRLFLGKFMLFPTIIYISHFLYFAPYPEIYPYFDVILQTASLLVFPIYYVYFRLLTVDQEFSFKKHLRFLIVPLVISVVYGLGVLLAPRIEFRTWLYNENIYPISDNIQFLKVMRIVIRITYLIQVLVSVTGNHLLIRKYGAKAEQFYSDIQDGKYNNARMLNYSIVIMSIAAFSYTFLGRHFLTHQDELIYLGWSIFTAMLFVIGYMGIKQKPINPTFDLDNNSEASNQTMDVSAVAQRKILKILMVEFEHNKIYLNSQLNILDVVQIVGTNRTYISNLINQQYKQNFCTFVNKHRLDELERVYTANPEYTNDMLAECCGFGSANSMKRAVSSKTGMSMSEWKKIVIMGS